MKISLTANPQTMRVILSEGLAKSKNLTNCPSAFFANSDRNFELETLNLIRFRQPCKS